MMRAQKTEAGQVALIVLLVMVVMLTLGVSVAKRGTSDVRISSQEEESARAFQAAEAGVERALNSLSGGSGGFGENTTYEVTTSEAGGEGFVSGQPVLTGETLLVDLSGASADLSGLEIYWAQADRDDCDSEPAAVEVGIVYQVGGETRVRRGGFDFKSRGNGFTSVTKGSYSFEGKTWCGKTTVSGITGDDEQVRLRPVYNWAMIGVAPSPSTASLGNQYVKVESVGKVTGGVSRAVEAQRNEPQLPPIFDYALFSGGGIGKGE